MRPVGDQASSDDGVHNTARAAMVQRQLRSRDITDERVLAAMRKVPRHLFVPADIRPHAEEDRALPIGHGQTISQPYVVAWMTQALNVQPEDRVLEIGTGSGYQTAVLAELAREVHTLEIIEPLAKRAWETLAGLGYAHVRTRLGSGYGGWPDAAPFDKIIVTAAPEHVPQMLVDQLAVRGMMVLPVGSLFDQRLTVITKTNDDIRHQKMLPVQFVPMVHRPD